jgi:O-antigen ligase
MQKSTLNLLLCVLIISLLVMSVLGGGMFVIPVFLCAAGIFSCLAWYFFKTDKPVLSIPAPVIVSAVIILLMLVSACPLPGNSDFLTGMKRFKQDNIVREAVSAAYRLKIIDNAGTSFAATRNRSGTLRMISLALLMLAAGMAVSSLEAKQRDLLLTILLAAGVVTAILGYLHQWVFPRERTIWWFINSARGHPVGAFINRTNHAGFLAMISPLALSWVMHGLYANRPLKIFTGTVAFVILSLAIVSALSRGAVVAFGIGSAVFAFHSLLVTGRRKTALAIPLVMLSIAAALQYSVKFTEPAHQTKIIERISTLSDPLSTPSGKDRLHLWKDSLIIFLDYPLIGAGANGFKMVYQQYRTETYRESFTHIENEYIQLLVDGGMIAAALAAMLMITMAVRWRTATRNMDLTMNIYGSGVLAGICTAAAHCLVDFPLHSPLYSFTLVLMASSVIACPTGDILTETAGIRITAKHAALLCLCAALFCLAVPGIGGKAALSRDQTDYIAGSSAPEAVKCLAWAPTSWQAWSQLARCAAHTRETKHYIFATYCLDQAVEYDPNNYLLWRSVGTIRMIMGDKDGSAMAFARMKHLRPWMEAPRLDQKGD